MTNVVDSFGAQSWDDEKGHRNAQDPVRNVTELFVDEVPDFAEDKVDAQIADDEYIDVISDSEPQTASSSTSSSTASSSSSSSTSSSSSFSTSSSSSSSLVNLIRNPISREKESLTTNEHSRENDSFRQHHLSHYQHMHPHHEHQLSSHPQHEQERGHDTKGNSEFFLFLYASFLCFSFCF